MGRAKHCSCVSLHEVCGDGKGCDGDVGLPFTDGCRLRLKERPAMVMFPALCAMGLLKFDSAGRLSITALGRCLTTVAAPNLVSYSGLEKDDPGVVEMALRLKNDGPLDAGRDTSASMRRARSMRSMPVVKIGRKALATHDDLLALIARHRQPGTSNI